MTVLAKFSIGAKLRFMTTAHLTRSVLSLPETERLELARKIVESLANEKEQAGAISEGVQRIEKIITGQTAGLSEKQFRQAVRCE